MTIYDGAPTGKGVLSYRLSAVAGTDAARACAPLPDVLSMKCRPVRVQVLRRGAASSRQMRDELPPVPTSAETTFARNLCSEGGEWTRNVPKPSHLRSVDPIPAPAAQGAAPGSSGASVAAEPPPLGSPAPAAQGAAPGSSGASVAAEPPPLGSPARVAQGAASRSSGGSVETVPKRRTRRSFTAAEKLRIVREVAACTKRGEVEVLTITAERRRMTSCSDHRGPRRAMTRLMAALRPAITGVRGARRRAGGIAERSAYYAPDGDEPVAQRSPGVASPANAVWRSLAGA